MKAGEKEVRKTDGNQSSKELMKIRKEGTKGSGDFYLKKKGFLFDHVFRL